MLPPGRGLGVQEAEASPLSLQDPPSSQVSGQASRRRPRGRACQRPLSCCAGLRSQDGVPRAHAGPRGPSGSPGSPGHLLPQSAACQQGQVWPHAWV